MSTIVIRCDGRQLRLAPGQSAVVGRELSCDVVLSDGNTSRRHLQIRNRDGSAAVTDLGSSNGTWIDGRRINGTVVLDARTEVVVGGARGVPVLIEPAQPPAQSPADRSRPTGGATARSTSMPGARPISRPLPRRPRTAAQSVPEVPSHTGVVFDRYALPSGPLPHRAAPGGSATLSGAAPQVVPVDNGASGGAFTIGRGLDNRVVVEDLLVSRHHARLTPVGPNTFDVQDLESRNGTYINGRRITRGRLTEGDLLAVGHSRFTVRAGQLVASLDEGDVNFVANHISFTLSDGKKLLDDVSFALEGSSLLAVVGPSGAGKSTLLKALTGSQPATTGEVYYDGRDLYDNFEDLRQRIGVVPQDDVVHRQLTVRQALRFAAELRFPDDLDKHLRDQRVDEVMAELGLTNHASTRVDKLSGGQRKRTSVALELLTRPSLLFLDEPTSGLDPGLDKQVMQTLRTLADGGRTVVVITHSVANLGVCDKVLLLAPGGKVAYFGPPDQLLPFFGRSDHADVFTQVAGNPDAAQEAFRRSPLAAEQIGRPLSAPRPQSQGAAADNSHRQQSIPSQLSTLVRRHVRVILADKGYAAFMLLLPVVLALLAMIMPGANGLAVPGPEVKTAGSARILLLVLVVGSIFMGMAASIRELVSERAIYHREKSVGLSPTAYLSSKLVVFGLLSAIQSVILVLVVGLHKKSATDALLLGSPKLELMLVCWVTAFGAVSLGLLMSSIVRTSEQVMPPLVAIVMAEMVLSGGLFALDGALRTVSMVVPSRWNFAAGASSVDLPRVLAAQRLVGDDSLWKHRTGTFALDLGVSLGFALVIALITGWRLARSKD